MGYKIGSFNLRNIGKTALGKLNLRSIETIAKIISEENFDIVALQEVLSEGAALSSNFGSKETMKKDLLYELGSNWSFAWADSRREPGVSNMYGLIDVSRICLGNHFMEGSCQKLIQVWN